MSDKPEPINLTPSETLRLTQAYQRAERAAETSRQASGAVQDVLQQVFGVRELPQTHSEHGWYLDIDGDNVKLTPANGSEDEGA